MKSVISRGCQEKSKPEQKGSEMGELSSPKVEEGVYGAKVVLGSTAKEVSPHGFGSLVAFKRELEEGLEGEVISGAWGNG